MEELKDQAMTMKNSESWTACNVSQQLVNEHSMPTKRRGFKGLGYEVVALGMKWWMTRSLVFPRPARAEWVLAKASRLLPL